MDRAQLAELAILAHQGPMNAVIDRGDSPVQQFYRGTTVFVTGGSGFLGKQLIEKLFRSCDISRLYVLLRSKKGMSIDHRMKTVLADPLYDTLRKKKPNFADKIIPIEGDVGEIRIGLSDKDWKKLSDEVNVIFHMAATVRFDEPLRLATFINIRGTRELITLAKECKQLKCFNHCSTAFAHSTVSRIGTDVDEKFYPCPMSPQVLIDMVENMDEDTLNDITPALKKDWPNTYTFTKALTEELIRTTAGDLPICIVKPPIVFSAYIEPSPGWIDASTAISSSVGVFLGVGLGILHVILTDVENVMSYAPVDYVNNAVIAASWYTVETRADRKGIPIYTISNSAQSIKWKSYREHIDTGDHRRLSTPKCLWYPYCIETKHEWIFWLLTWVLHYIPGYFIDAVVDLLGVRPKKIPPLVKIYTKIYKMAILFSYFTRNSWNFKDDNLQAMIERLSPADKVIYNCDVRTIDWMEHITSIFIGLRRFVLKDGLQGSDYAYRKVQWLYYANIIFMCLYAYVAWKFFYFAFSVIHYGFALVF